MRCVVCLDARARRVEAAGGGMYTCSPGCRGSRAVCEACNDRLHRCVFCRSRIVRRDGIDAEPEEREAGDSAM